MRTADPTPRGLRTTHGRDAWLSWSACRCVGVIVTAVFLLAGHPAAIHAACNNLGCTQSTCTITGTNYVDNSCVIPWDGKTVTIDRSGKLLTAANGQSFTINAAALIVRGTLQAQGGTLTVNTTSPGPTSFRTEVVNNSPGKIDVRNGGKLRIIAAGPVELYGQDVNADGGTAGTGGAMWVSGSAISTISPVHADGTSGGDGGYMELNATGDISIGGLTTVNGQGPVNGASPATGGAIYINAGGTLNVSKNLLAKGDQDGDGGVINLIAGGTATLAGNYSANGVGNTGGANGGRISLDADGATISGAWTAVGNYGAAGGGVSVRTHGGALAMTSTSSIDVSSGTFGGGDAGVVELRGDADVSVGGDITANSGGDGSHGGDITIVAGSANTLTVSNTLQAISTTNNGDRDGAIYVGGACTITITGSLKTRNQPGGGHNTIEYLGSLTATGATLLAGDLGGNSIACPCVDVSPADGVCDAPPTCAQSPSLSGATINPSPVIAPWLAPPCS